MGMDDFEGDLVAMQHIGIAPPKPLSRTAVEWGIQINACDEPLDPALDLAAQMGMRWIKHQVRWGDIEYLEGNTRHFRWACSDQLVDKALARNFKILFSVTTSPPYLRKTYLRGTESVLGPPQNPYDYATFINILLTRYKGRVHAIEIWNEPNLDAEWDIGVNPFLYTYLLKLSYATVKSIDPSVMVILGGVAPIDHSAAPRYMQDVEFLRAVHALGGMLWADCVGYHANGPPNLGYFDDVVRRYEHHILREQPKELRRPMCLTEVSFSLPINGQLPPQFAWAIHNTEEAQAQRFEEWIAMSRNVSFLRLAIIFNLNYREGGAITPNSIAALERSDLRGLSLRRIANALERYGLRP